MIATTGPTNACGNGTVVSAEFRKIKNCKFNQRGTSILATTSVGFLIYALDRDGNIALQHEYEVGMEIKFAERLYSTNLVAYSTLKNPEIFVVFHCKRRKIVCDFRYPAEIDIIRFNRQRVIIAVKDVIYIHNIRNMQILHLIKEVPENPFGILELACADNCGYLALPWKPTSGAVRIFDVFQLQDIACIQAHQSPLAFIRFDSLGGRIATASVKGTCIRVFDSSHGNKLYQFRRGFKEVRIVSLAFSLDGCYLSTTSDSQTVHIFKFHSANAIGQDSMGFLKSLGGLLSSEERASVTMPNPLHGQNASGFLGSLSGGVVNFMLTSPSGILKIYSLETACGSLSPPLRQHNLREIKKSSLEENGGMTNKEVEPFTIPPSNFVKAFEVAHAEVKESMKQNKKCLSPFGKKVSE